MCSHSLVAITSRKNQHAFWLLHPLGDSGSNEALAETLNSTRLGASLEVALPANGQARAQDSEWESIPLHSAAGSRLDVRHIVYFIGSYGSSHNGVSARCMWYFDQFFGMVPGTW